MSNPGRSKLSVLAIFFIVFVVINIWAPAVWARSNQTVITIWHSLPKRYHSLFNSMVGEYIGTLHGLVKVNMVTFDTSEQLRQKLLRGKEHPDIALIDTRWQEVIAKKYQIYYMEDLMRNLVGNSIFVHFKTDTFKSIWKSCLRGKDLFSMPFMAYNRALLINEEIVELLEIKKKPRKWEDIIVIGQEIVKPRSGAAGKFWAFYIPAEAPPEKLAEFYQVFLWQWNRDIYEKFMGGELSGFDSAEGKSILKMMVDMIHVYKIAPLGAVNKEKVAMFIATPREYLSGVERGKRYKVVRWPGRARSSNDLVVYSFIVFKGPKKRKLEKIWNLIYHLCEFKSCLKWALATPFLPPNKQVVLSPDYFSFLQGRPGMRKFLQQLKNSKVSVRDERKAKILRILGENMKLAFANRISVDKCLRKSAEDCNAILDPSGKLRQKRNELRELESFVKQVWDKDYGL